jgi:hypothetical protein
MNGTTKVNLDKAAGANKWSFTINPNDAASITLIIDLCQTEYTISYYTLQADGTYKLAETLTYTMAELAGVEAEHQAILNRIGVFVQPLSAGSGSFGIDGRKFFAVCNETPHLLLPLIGKVWMGEERIQAVCLFIQRRSSVFQLLGAFAQTGFGVAINLKTGHGKTS